MVLAVVLRNSECTGAVWGSGVLLENVSHCLVVVLVADCLDANKVSKYRRFKSTEQPVMSVTLDAIPVVKQSQYVL